MSATAFLRQRRAAAVTYIAKTLTGRDKDRVAEIMGEVKLTPGDLGNMAGNSDVLAIADRIAAEELDQPELDALEVLNVLENGARAAVHSPDVRDDQFEDRLQHPSQETVGVGNMHDAPALAAEDLANVSAHRVDNNDGSLAAAAAEKLDESGLSDHANLPPAAPTSAPAADNQITAEDDAPTDPAGDNRGPETVVDLPQAVEDLQAAEAVEEKLEKLGSAALLIMDRDALIAYAGVHEITLQNVGPRTMAKTIANQIIAAQKGDAA